MQRGSRREAVTALIRVIMPLNPDVTALIRVIMPLNPDVTALIRVIMPLNPDEDGASATCPAHPRQWMARDSDSPLS